VILSPDLSENPLSQTFKNEITRLTEELEAGSPLGEFLPKSIQNLDFADRLLKDWGISHLHIFLTTERIGKKEDKYVVYFVFDNDSIFLIDLQDHNHFYEKRLLEIIDNYNPDFLPKLKGIRPDSFSRELLKNLREKDVGYSISVNGSTFPAGMPRAVDSRYCAEFCHLVEKLQEEFLLNEEQFWLEFNRQVKVENDPDLHLVFDTTMHQIVLVDLKNRVVCNWDSSILVRINSMARSKRLV